MKEGLRAAQPTGFKVLAGWALALVCLAVRSAASDAGDWDPRLGSPFKVRDRAVLGSETAPIVVIEFSSFKCTHCRAFHRDVFPALRKHYIDLGEVQWVIINASNDPQDRVAPAFLAARGALQQGRYWAVVDSLYEAGQEPPEALAGLIAKGAGPGGASLEASLRDSQVQAAVAADFADYEMAGIRGTPTFFLRRLKRDGHWRRAMIEDAPPTDYFQRVLDRLLTEP